MKCFSLLELDFIGLSSYKLREKRNNASKEKARVLALC